MNGLNCIADAMHYICFSYLRDISNELNFDRFSRRGAACVGSACRSFDVIA